MVMTHLPSECGNPPACPQHAELWNKHFGCTCAWNPGQTEPLSCHADCPNPTHSAGFVDWGAFMTRPEVVEEKVVIPEPEVPARRATATEIPKGAMTVGKKAAANGFVVIATYARGPRLDQHWKVVEISDSLLLRGKHEDGRRFAAHWITKTAQRGAKAGQVSWSFDFAYTRTGSCSSPELNAYLVTSH